LKISHKWLAPVAPRPLCCSQLFCVFVTVQRLLFACYSGDELRPHTLIVNSLLALIPSG